MPGLWVNKKTRYNSSVLNTQLKYRSNPGLGQDPDPGPDPLSGGMMARDTLLDAVLVRDTLLATPRSRTPGASPGRTPETALGPLPGMGAPPLDPDQGTGSPRKVTVPRGTQPLRGMGTWRSQVGIKCYWTPFISPWVGYPKDSSRISILVF